MPSRFTGEIRFTSLDADCLLWRLDEELVYELGSIGSNEFIHVPSGYNTDGASIPSILKGVLPPFGRYTRAALVHDYLCDLVWENRPHASCMTLKRADEIFYEALRVCQVSKFLSKIMYWAVVLRRKMLRHY
jgi:Protein of unknown function (DUF1353)